VHAHSRCAQCPLLTDDRCTIRVLQARGEPGTWFGIVLSQGSLRARTLHCMACDLLTENPHTPAAWSALFSPTALHCMRCSLICQVLSGAVDVLLPGGGTVSLPAGSIIGEMTIFNEGSKRSATMKGGSPGMLAMMLTSAVYTLAEPSPSPSPHPSPSPSPHPSL
jgi:hypothetical protein